MRLEYCGNVPIGSITGNLIQVIPYLNGLPLRPKRNEYYSAEASATKEWRRTVTSMLQATHYDLREFSSSIA